MTETKPETMGSCQEPNPYTQADPPANNIRVSPYIFQNYN